MKADLEYYFVGDTSGAELKVHSQIDTVTLTYSKPDRWDPNNNQEVHGDKGGISLSPTDARELAEMLFKAADHVDDLNRNNPESHMKKGPPTKEKTVKINSILTQNVDLDGRVLSYSMSKYKTGKKPTVEKTRDLFEIMDPKISQHTSMTLGVVKYIVTISTTKGKFIKTYSAVKEIKMSTADREEKCGRCGRTDFMIFRDMTSRRICECGETWPCPNNNEPQRYTLFEDKYVLASAYDSLKAELDEVKQDKARLSGIVYGQSIDLKEIGKENNETKAENERLRSELEGLKSALELTLNRITRTMAMYSRLEARAAKLVEALEYVTRFYENPGKEGYMCGSCDSGDSGWSTKGYPYHDDKEPHKCPLLVASEALAEFNSDKQDKP